MSEIPARTPAQSVELLANLSTTIDDTVQGVGTAILEWSEVAGMIRQYLAQAEDPPAGPFARMTTFFRERMPLLAHTGQSRKLQEEMAEFLAEPSAEEAADIAIVLGAYAYCNGWDLDAAIAAKMEKNEAREWEHKGDGLYKHVKTAPLGTAPDQAATA